MCLLAVRYRLDSELPVLVAANREESYARPSTGPLVLDGSPRVVCALDRQAGGTWLGINEHGLLVAVTNRRHAAVPSQPRSRGLLCRDLLACANADEAAQRAAEELRSGRYAGCYLLCLDLQSAYVVDRGERLRVVPVEAGLHVVTVEGLNDPADPRTRRATEWLSACQPSSAADWLRVAGRVCGSHGDAAESARLMGDAPGRVALCVHGPGHGTVSSTLLALSSDEDRIGYWHAAGPPCRTPYQDYSALARQVLQRQGTGMG